MKKNDVKQSKELKKLFSEETLNSMEMARIQGGAYENEEDFTVVKDVLCPTKSCQRFPNCTVKGNTICQ